MSEASTPESARHFKLTVDPTKLGECAAVQPLSGITRVDETFAVSGIGRGGYVRKEETPKGKA